MLLTHLLICYHCFDPNANISAREVGHIHHNNRPYLRISFIHVHLSIYTVWKVIFQIEFRM